LTWRAVCLTGIEMRSGDVRVYLIHLLRLLGLSWSWTTPECCSVSLFLYLKNWRKFKTLRSAIWFFCNACHKLEVDIYYLARSGVDIIETGWT
jgi:hypothetical protein